MPRIARVVAVGLPHHITQRGNYRQNVFFDDNDRNKYLSWIQEYSRKYSLSLLGYCLMHNHVHFIAIPEKEEALAKTFNTAHMCYSQYINKKMKVSGHLWQGRFYSCVLDESHLMAGLRYIERNPVRAKIATNPWEWKWSSASVHIGQERNYIGLKNISQIIGMNFDSWKQYIDTLEDGNVVDAIRKHTLTGLPLGESGFIKKLETEFGKSLIALPRGRPVKKNK